MAVADELSKLAELKDRGLLTESEFEAQKAKLLVGDQQAPPPTEPMVKEEKKGSPVFITLLVVAGIVFAFLYSERQLEIAPRCAL
ncbi:SHOCT domain-containing protein [Bordetella sp. 15P40C-2]|uniref:SHOCT domain-containing protein n=1 Tax=Bordetella sp. 15P40C-2 TaxID=2572246 RepID=UPI0019216E76|nr:SHOCT domain-containing protein [Bordetella sp. 15P40C-2]